VVYNSDNGTADGVTKIQMDRNDPVEKAYGCFCKANKMPQTSMNSFHFYMDTDEHQRTKKLVNNRTTLGYYLKEGEAVLEASTFWDQNGG
jgi:hypothetical protein